MENRKDVLTPEQRSSLMSRIRGKNTGPEKVVFRRLRKAGVYFSRHSAGLPGKPDVVFRRAKVAVFIDGEFWHGKGFDSWQSGLSEPWRKKISGNMERDRAVDGTLEAMGWQTLHLWGRDVMKDPDGCVKAILMVRECRLEWRRS